MRQCDCWVNRQHREGRQLRINGIVTHKLLANPDLYNAEDQPCLVVMKDGSTTDLTVGLYAGLESYFCDDLGVESSKLGIYNYDKKKGPVFSKKGDSGALILDGKGRMVGQLHSRINKGGSTNNHITHTTPTHFLIRCIKGKYPHANFNSVTYTAMEEEMLHDENMFIMGEEVARVSGDILIRVPALITTITNDRVLRSPLRRSTQTWNLSRLRSHPHHAPQHGLIHIPTCIHHSPSIIPLQLVPSWDHFGP